MKILITGGAGYIGTELSYTLAANTAVEKIIIYDNLSRDNYNAFIGVSKYFDGKMQFIEGDILDTRKLKKTISDVDCVIHLAAKVTTPFADQNPHLFEQVNHWGTAEITYAIENAKNIKRFIYASSVSVYGSSPDENDIDAAINPRTFYGISKMRGEEHAARLVDKLPTYILRLGNVYGYSKSMRFDAVINKFMFDANFKKRITINGDGNQHRSFAHINYVAQVLKAFTLQPEPERGIYNVTEHNLSVNEIVDELKELYPELEMIFVNQHMKLRGLKVKPDERMTAFKLPSTDIKKSLEEFKKEFTY